MRSGSTSFFVRLGSITMDIRSKSVGKEIGMGSIFKVPAMIIWFVGGIWGLIVCLGIVSSKLGFIGVLIGLLVFPAVLYLAPWYAGFVDDNWFPVMLIYGTSFTAWVLYAIGAAIDND